MNDRITHLNDVLQRSDGPVVYWMSRDQRAHDNWALLHAWKEAHSRKVGLGVLFVFNPSFPRALPAQIRFMLTGLMETQTQLAAKHIPMFFLTGDPVISVRSFLTHEHVSLLVTDFAPTRSARHHRESIAKTADTEVHEVDTHNIIPCRLVSEKQEYAAYTIRPKIHRLLPHYLTPITPLKTFPHPWKWNSQPASAADIARSLPTDSSGTRYPTPGADAGLKTLTSFIRSGLSRYPDDRNDPNKNAQSRLSPYVHFGQLSAHRIALSIGASNVSWKSKEVFLEELIVRRELSDNFCFYNASYDTIDGAAPWAKRTLDAHAGDRREYRYSLEEFQGSLTHDPLWNAAQNQMRKTGIMHGYLRMYWAKKILEWTVSPQQAIAIAITLNDTYSLDGRDPNGYAGILWAIAGLHDRPWGERPVFGMIRYMNAQGCARKFRTQQYINSWT